MQRSTKRFRETLWFKRGAEDSEWADRAHEELRRGKSVTPKEEPLSLEDRYSDDALSEDEVQKYSLSEG
jgi:hypothetical protein